MKPWVVRLGAMGLLLGGMGQGKADTINFFDQGFSGPPTFSGTIQQNINTTSLGGVGVSLSGGTILTVTTFLPVLINAPPSQTTLYGTAALAGTNYTNPIVITFSQPVQDFIADLYNGSTISATFQVSDGLGDTSMFTLPSNANDGYASVSLAATGITSVTITQLTNDPGSAPDPNPNDLPGWDFFVNNLQFTPSTIATPEPSTLTLFVSGIAGMAVYGWRRRKVASM